MSVETKHQNRAFITQEEPYNEFFEEATMHTTKMQGFENEEKGYKSLSDKKVKNILSRVETSFFKFVYNLEA